MDAFLPSLPKRALAPITKLQSSEQGTCGKKKKKRRKGGGEGKRRKAKGGAQLSSDETSTSRSGSSTGAFARTEIPERPGTRGGREFAPLPIAMAADGEVDSDVESVYSQLSSTTSTSTSSAFHNPFNPFTNSINANDQDINEIEATPVKDVALEASAASSEDEDDLGLPPSLKKTAWKSTKEVEFRLSPLSQNNLHNEARNMAQTSCDGEDGALDKLRGRGQRCQSDSGDSDLDSFDSDSIGLGIRPEPSGLLHPQTGHPARASGDVVRMSPLELAKAKARTRGTVDRHSGAPSSSSFSSSTSLSDSSSDSGRRGRGPKRGRGGKTKSKAAAKWSGSGTDELGVRRKEYGDRKQILENVVRIRKEGVETEILRQREFARKEEARKRQREEEKQRELMAELGKRSEENQPKLDEAKKQWEREAFENELRVARYRFVIEGAMADGSIGPSQLSVVTRARIEARITPEEHEAALKALGVTHEAFERAIERGRQKAEEEMRRAQEQAEARKTQEAEERQKEKLSSQRQENGEQPGRTIQAEENPSNPPNKPEVRAHNISRSSSEHSWREAALPKERRGKRRPRRKKAPGKTRQVHDSIEDLEKKKLQELKKLVPPAALSQRAAQSGGLRVPDNHGGNENLTQDKSGRLSGEDHRRQSTGRQREVDRSKIVSEGNNERRGLLVGTSNISPRIMHLLQKVRLLCYKDVERALAEGVPVDARDHLGDTPLMVACQQGDKRMVKVILRGRANMDAVNHAGHTAVHICYSFNYRALAEYIISKGARAQCLDCRRLNRLCSAISQKVALAKDTQEEGVERAFKYDYVAAAREYRPEQRDRRASASSRASFRQEVEREKERSQRHSVTSLKVEPENGGLPRIPPLDLNKAMDGRARQKEAAKDGATDPTKATTAAHFAVGNDEASKQEAEAGKKAKKAGKGGLLGKLMHLFGKGKKGEESEAKVMAMLSSAAETVIDFFSEAEGKCTSFEGFESVVVRSLETRKIIDDARHEAKKSKVPLTVSKLQSLRSGAGWPSDEEKFARYIASRGPPVQELLARGEKLISAESHPISFKKIRKNCLAVFAELKGLEEGGKDKLHRVFLPAIELLGRQLHVLMESAARHYIIATRGGRLGQKKGSAIVEMYDNIVEILELVDDIEVYLDGAAGARKSQQYGVLRANVKALEEDYPKILGLED